ncbi:olfactomedin-like [Varanus komodoensis]|uniref:olfactomedin-like n=1 Tax=Varanus komodoensis TaxID=61221 RepID=UPI001CF7E80B|nr:olfactomedin-like [Varanus komodoensis]
MEQVIVESGHIQKVLGVKDASGQCICSMELAHVIFPARKVEQLESDFYNLTNHLQNNLNKIYNKQAMMTSSTSNLTDLDKRLRYAKAFGTHVDLDFRKLINDIHTVVSMAEYMKKNATTPSSRAMINNLISEINTIDTLVTKMEKYDRNNIITAQREVTTLRKKLEDCEEMLNLDDSSAGPVAGPSPIGTCDRGMLIKVSAPVLVKLNWKGSEFKAGSWGKDFAMGTKFPDHYWVFPANKDERTLETYRLYSSYKKLLLYSPIREYTLNINSKPTCENCGQGGGVIFFNGSFFYNCFDSRSLCKADPFSMRVTQMELEDQDPASFNNWFSYKGVKYQDMDMAGDEKGLWMVHGSTLANGNMVIRKVDPETLKTGTPWITSQPKEKLSNSFMICGMLYATRRKNSTHEEIYYVYDTNTSQERNIQIYMEKPLPTVQSMSYNPNDQKLYMFNDAYLVYYNLMFSKEPKGMARQAILSEQQKDPGTEGLQSVVNREGSKEKPSPTSNQQQGSGSTGGDSSNQEESPITLSIGRQEAVRAGSHTIASE